MPKSDPKIRVRIFGSHGSHFETLLLSQVEKLEEKAKAPNQSLRVQRIAVVDDIKFKNPFHARLTNNAAPFNSAVMTVDVAVVKIETRQVLLGRKHEEKKWRFFGGFVDPLKDKSAKLAAKRETREEAGDIEIDDLIVLDTPMVDDPRYAGDKDKIFTVFFAAKYIFGRPQGGDDIAEVKWFDISKVTKADIMPCHWPLLDIFLKFYNDPKRLA